MSERTAFSGLSFQGAIAFVTGAASGIGLETALSLADLGANLAVLDWTPGAAAATAERMGRRALAFWRRRGRREDLDRRVRVDAPIMAVKVRGSILVVREAAKQMRPRRKARSCWLPVSTGFRPNTACSPIGCRKGRCSI
jgi:NAD(P)-dependent dehydrogenase (short-subunit alcohol dehydrogenase family)